MDEMINSRDNRDISTAILLSLLFLYVLTQPLYLWASGYPQLADIIGLLLIGGAILKYGLLPKNMFLIVSILFASYITLINLTWGLMLNNHIESLLSSSWYIYNILMMLTCISIFKKSKTSFEVIKYAVIFVILLELVYVLVFPGSSLRESGTFNNPNQLTYFALLYLSIFYIVSKKSNVSNLVFWIITVSSVFIVLISLSKAGMLSITTLIFIEVFIRFNKIRVVKLLLVIIITSILFVLLGSLTMEHIKDTELFENVKSRLLDIGINKDDNASGRGYDRIINHPQYNLFGAGEVGTHKRFESINNEFHSTLGNVLFSYGLVGLILFLSLIYLVIRKNSFIYFYPLVSVFMYSLTHNGIRNSMLWIMLAIIYVINMEKNKSV